MSDAASSLVLQLAEPCAKRRKRDEIQQHDLLWFEDGNVILITEDRVGFKVHKSVLSLHSDLFKDLFKLPQPAESDRVDDCSVVHLQDASSGMAPFLSLFYNNNPRYLLFFLLFLSKYESNITSSYPGTISDAVPFTMIQNVCHLSTLR